MRLFERLYGKLVTGLIRIRAGRRPPLIRFPVLIAAPDLPVPKFHNSSKQCSWAASINDGLHFHAIILIPGRNILKTNFEHYLAAEQARLVQGTAIVSVHAEAITYSPAQVVSYVMKSLKRQRFGGDDVLILPRAWSEMPSPAKRTKVPFQ